MDAGTAAHLQNWIESQFGEDQWEMFAAMSEQYRSDPELYAREGWWRCHDDMIAAGHHTL